LGFDWVGFTEALYSGQQYTFSNEMDAEEYAASMANKRLGRFTSYFPYQFGHKELVRTIFGSIQRGYYEYTYESDAIEDIFNECLSFINTARQADALETCMCFDSDCDLLRELVTPIPGIISSLKMCRNGRAEHITEDEAQVVFNIYSSAFAVFSIMTAVKMTVVQIFMESISDGSVKTVNIIPENNRKSIFLQSDEITRTDFNALWDILNKIRNTIIDKGILECEHFRNLLPTFIRLQLVYIIDGSDEQVMRRVSRYSIETTMAFNTSRYRILLEAVRHGCIGLHKIAFMQVFMSLAAPYEVDALEDFFYA